MSRENDKRCFGRCKVGECKGWLIATGLTLTSMPPQEQAQCDACGRTTGIRQPIYHTVWRRDESQNDKVADAGRCKMGNAKTPASPRSLKRLVRPFRAGDIVKFARLGEEWQLACDEECGEVMPCGWPMCIAKADDCDLARPATDKEREDMLKMWIGGGDDERAIVARRQWANNQLRNAANE